MRDELHALDPLDLLEAELSLVVQPQRGTVAERQRLTVHVVGQHRQVVAHLLDGVCVVVDALVGAVTKGRCASYQRDDVCMSDGGRCGLTIKYVRDPVSPDDGERILVDRLWPRGVPKERAHLSEWRRDLAPSSELRQWFGHDPARWNEFRRRYRHELVEHV